VSDARAVNSLFGMGRFEKAMFFLCVVGGGTDGGVSADSWHDTRKVARRQGGEAVLKLRLKPRLKPRVFFFRRSAAIRL
jgi:hypothetical protein